MNNLENLDDALKSAKKLVTELITNTHCDVCKIPATQGVYLIYNKNNEVIYVGKAKNLKRRINSDHISGEVKISTSTFRRQLIQRMELKAGKDLRKWIIDNCLFSYVEISDSDMCGLVESLTILTLRSSGSNLFNHLVS